MSPDNDDRHKERPFDGLVRPLRESDLTLLQPILEMWLRSRVNGELLPEEVQEDLGFMKDSLNGHSERSYLVAEAANGDVIGMIGLATPSDRMREFATTSNPKELVNAYVHKNYRGGKGVGSALVVELENLARAKGCTEIVVNSGPRYKNSGWGFYDKLPGFTRIGVAVELYDKGGDAPVWHKNLV